MRPRTAPSVCAARRPRSSGRPAARPRGVRPGRQHRPVLRGARAESQEELGRGTGEATKPFSLDALARMARGRPGRRGDSRKGLVHRDLKPRTCSSVRTSARCARSTSASRERWARSAPRGQRPRTTSARPSTCRPSSARASPMRLPLGRVQHRRAAHELVAGAPPFWGKRGRRSRGARSRRPGRSRAPAVRRSSTRSSAAVSPRIARAATKTSRACGGTR